MRYDSLFFSCFITLKPETLIIINIQPEFWIQFFLILDSESESRESESESESRFNFFESKMQMQIQ
jgi:hypothetical protein